MIILADLILSQVFQLYNNKKYVQDLITLTNYSFMEYINEAKKKICLFCFKTINSFNCVIKLPCSCYFCSQKCCEEFYVYFLVHDFDRKIELNLKKYLFSSCPCGYKYTFNDYNNLYKNFNNNLIRENIRKLLKGKWITTCAKCGCTLNENRLLSGSYDCSIKVWTVSDVALTLIKTIKEHEEELCKYMLERLEEVPNIIIYGPKDANKRASVISINIGNMDSGEITFLLDSEYDIATRSGIHCAPLAHKTLGTLEQGAVRFSIGYFNTKEEIDKAITALKQIAKNN